MVTLEINRKEVEFKQWKFPAGEVGIKLPKIDPENNFRVNILGLPSSDDFFIALQVLDALRLAKVPKEYVELYMPYIPYARQDRACHEGESFALRIFVRALLHFDVIGMLTVIDPHSKVFNDIFHNWNYNEVELNEIKQWECTNNLPKFDCIIAPDLGATQKAELTQPEVDHRYLMKTRTAEGIIYDDYQYDTIKGNVCVVDDILDGGATFLSLAKMLERTQPNIQSLSLYVTHGIFSQGCFALSMHYDKLYCYNLMNQDQDHMVTVLK